jgi:formylglycine-generating enzyme required for sulfatase activity
VVSADSAAVREGPGSAYAIIAICPVGTTLAVLGRSSGGLWLKVRAPDDSVGWARRSDLQVNKAAAEIPVADAPPLPTPAEPAAGATRVLERSGIVMVYVPSGEFVCAHFDKSAPPPQSRVYLDGFWIGRTEVTNAQFQRFIDDGGYQRREFWNEQGWGWVTSSGEKHPWDLSWDDPAYNQPDLPVVGVNCFEAQAFAAWAGSRLPTDAEWEKAARGTDGRIYPWGDEPESRGNTDGRVGHLTAVGSFPGDVSPYGCLDMAGSAREYTVGPKPGVTCGRRGGSWGGYAWAATPCLANGLPWPSGALGVWKPEERNQIEGFRIACSR